MRLSLEERIINNLPEKLVNRKYRAIKKRRNLAMAFAAGNFGFAAMDAIAKNGFMTIFMGGSTLLCLNIVETAINILRLLQPKYNEIVTRAKNINKIKHHLDTSV